LKDFKFIRPRIGAHKFNFSSDTDSSISITTGENHPKAYPDLAITSTNKIEICSLVLKFALSSLQSKQATKQQQDIIQPSFVKFGK
jgi:hypothetical protein